MPDIRTAHKIDNTFHVSYNISLGSGQIVEIIQDETGTDILDELSRQILSELRDIEDAKLLEAHKIGMNTFVAKVT